MSNLIAANVKQRPLRTAVSTAGVALGVVLVVLMGGLARGMVRDAAERQSNVDAEIRFLPVGDVSVASNPLILPTAYVDAILKGVQPGPDEPDVEPKPPISGVLDVTPVGEWIQEGVGGLGYEMVDGIDYASFTRTTELRISEGRVPDASAEYEAIVDQFYTEHTRDVNGELIRVGSQINVLGHRFTVVGIYEPPMLARIKIPLRTMQQMFGGADNCSFLMIKVQNPESTNQVIETLKQYYPGHKVISTEDIPALYSQGFVPVEIFLDVVIGLATVVSTLVILLAMYTTIVERTREIGILKSLGASKTFIVGVIEQEAALISTLGVLAGFAISIAGKFLIESNTRLRIDLRPEWLLAAAAIGLIGGLVGALYPAIRAARLDPIEALNYE
jgi:putative ABC transport system permease protein